MKFPRIAYLLSCILILAGIANAQKATYRIVDTGQDTCHGNNSEIAFPKSGQPFYGQDAQYQGLKMNYRNNGDGTITDLNTGLVWQKTPDFNTRSWEESKVYAGSLKLAKHDDWRLPSIKELFSIVDFRGNQHTGTPYLDIKVFDFKYPDPSSGMRSMDAQYWSINRYLGTTMRGDTSAFGFNFADGRIKSYPIAFGGGRRAGCPTVCHSHRASLLWTMNIRNVA